MTVFIQQRFPKPSKLFSLAITIMLATSWLPGAPAAAQDSAQTDTTVPGKLAIIGSVHTTPIDAVWQAILKEANIPFEVTEVMQGRRRRMFIDGLITLDCCFSPTWRNRPEEQVVQLFTDSFYTAEIRFVFKKGNVIPISSPEQIKYLRFAAVRGFAYTLEDFFGETIIGKSPSDTLRLVELGRAQVTEAAKVLFDSEMAHTPRALELGDLANYTNLHARVHISRADLLPRLNAAIARMKASGRIKQILQATTSNTQR